MTAVADGSPRVMVELILVEGGPALEVVEMDLAEARQAAVLLRRLVVDVQEPVEG